MELRITTLVASGNLREALGLIAEAYGEPVGRYCSALVGSYAEGEELLQEALIEAYRAMPRFRGEAPVRTWFFGIARRVCSQHLRRRERRRSLLKGWRWFGGGDAESTPPDPVERSETRDALNAALRHLKPHLREAVLLRYQSGLDGSEVAAVLGISHAAARKRVSLGVQAMRSELRPWLMQTNDVPARSRGAGAKNTEAVHDCASLPTPVESRQLGS